VGCQVALAALGEMTKMEEQGAWDAFKSDGGWNAAAATTSTPTASDNSSDAVWSVWSTNFINTVSHHEDKVDCVWALGSVLAVTLKSSDGAAGYKSTAAQELQARLRQSGPAGEGNVHSRVLGSVFYIMTGQKTTPEAVQRLEQLVLEALAA
jgi:dethiobiotin synthetase/adenosylmethionine--8-amino-7-oxononanoate aminotransferase